MTKNVPSGDALTEVQVELNRSARIGLVAECGRHTYTSICRQPAASVPLRVGYIYIFLPVIFMDTIKEPLVVKALHRSNGSIFILR